jgi:mRNA interferase RelE/StbE
VNYAVIALARVERDLSRLDKKDYERVEAGIFQLGREPRPTNCQKLKGREAWRIRVGDYRVIYEINDDAKPVRIIRVGHRREVYR